MTAATIAATLAAAAAWLAYTIGRRRGRREGYEAGRRASVPPLLAVIDQLHDTRDALDRLRRQRRPPTGTLTKPTRYEPAS